MANYITTKYGTKINVTGLTPEQIAKVRSTAEDKGAYGTKGAALADTFRAKNTATKPVQPAPTVPQTPATNTPVPVPGPALGVDPKTGVIDPNKAVPTITGAVQDDTNKNFQMQNPTQQTDVLGNKQEITTDPTTGKTIINQTAGGGLSAANQAFTNAAMGFANAGDNAKAAADANYSYLTRNYSQDKSRELEATKQELANRGIPLNFAGDPNNPDNLYSRAIGSIDQKYQGLYDQANNQALMARDTSLSTQAGVIGALGGAVAQQSPGFTAFQGGQSNQGEALLNLLGTISDADMTKYGIDKEMAAKLKAIAASRSGGKSGSNDSGPIIGGNAPGFGV